MSNVIINDTHLKDIANVIRIKNGSSTKYKPSEMSNAINELEEVTDYIDTSLIEDNENVNYLTVRLIKKLPYMDTSEVVNGSYMFSRFSGLEELQELDCSKMNNVSNMLASCLALKICGGFKNLGMAFLPTASANYTNYTLNLSNTILDHDSLMNVINKVYDIASLGVQPQSIVFGTANKNKLSEEELQILTSKGWSYS